MGVTPKKSTALELLTYGGEVVHMKAERMSLTDMWKAAGRPTNREPFEWLRSADAVRFIAALGEMVTTGNSRSELVVTVNGGKNPGTWAHWQIAMNYARYLDPAFAVKCNIAVKERFEGRGVVAPSLADDELIAAANPREIRLTLNQSLRLAKMAGLEGPHALHAASAQTFKLTGHDTLKTMGIARLPAPEGEKPLIPTQIGERLGGLSAQAVNKMLCRLGFQEKDECGEWAPTAKGRDAGGHFVLANRQHAEGVAYQLVWHPRIVDMLQIPTANDGNVLPFTAPDAG